MANKQPEPISHWGCAKAIFFSMTVIVLLAGFIVGCDNPKKSGSPYSTVLVWIYVLAVLYGLSKAKFKKGWFD